MADSNEVIKDQMLEALKQIHEPGIETDLVTAGFVQNIEASDQSVEVVLRAFSPNSPFQEEMEGEVQKVVKGLLGSRELSIVWDLQIPTDGRQRGSDGSQIKNAIAVGSGKGGVGKSTIAVNLAVSLARAGAKVGLLDADVYGPNIPTMLGLRSLPPPQDGKMVPAEAFGVKVVSIAFLVEPGKPLIWRGPMLHSAIRQFIHDVIWGELDYLIIDLPPGTGDAPLSLSQSLPLSGAVVVTLPQKVSIEDATRGLEMFRTMKVRVYGIVENMSYLELPDGSQLDIFGQGGGKEMADELQVPFLGSVPMDRDTPNAGDSGIPIVISHPESSISQSLNNIAYDLALRVGTSALQQRTAVPIQIIDD